MTFACRSLDTGESSSGFPAEHRRPRDRFGARSPVAVVGFTLLEVLVALAIFALAAVVLGATYVNALNAYEAATRRNEYSEDLRFVRAAVLTEPDRNKVEEGGDLPLGGNKRARWKAEIAATDTVDLFVVAWTCEITDPSRREPYRTSQTFLLLRPTWSDPVERSTLLEQVRERIAKIQGTTP
jgi:general secretion pathway protein I